MQGVIKTNAADLYGELCEEIRLFLSIRHIEQYREDIGSDGLLVVHELIDKGKVWRNECRAYIDGEQISEFASDSYRAPEADELEFKKWRKWGAKSALYACLEKHFNKKLPWGALTGVRPTKLMRSCTADYGTEHTERIFKDVFYVSEEKTALLRDICARQKPFLDSLTDRDIDVYIGIPFCTSRCAYCSFLSAVVSGDGHREQAYVEALLHEMEALRPVMESYRVRSVYIGGGTPTSLSAELLSKVAHAAGRLGAKEFTVEAGRPDTITEEKLAALKAAGVNRISVNAQTTSNHTLSLIGRSHSADDFFSAFELAEKFNFDAVNTDLIIGLPMEGEREFEKSLSDVIALAPDNITVHTLAIKRASKFGMDNETAFADKDTAERIVAMSADSLSRAGYDPYYMYRQKYMAGSMENVGYAKPGKECVYNIDIMEEQASIMAFGAGSISKRVRMAEKKIGRAACVKDVSHYLARTDEMAERKRALFV